MARDGVKKSNFIGTTTVPSGSTFDYVYNGQNYKIVDEDLFKQFGVLGTIQQEGDPTGAPILNKSGTVNNIRNIENGSGIQASISVQGGVEISHNFDIKTAGVPIIPNGTDTSPIIRSLAAGPGINLSVVNDTITVENSSVPTSSKTVTVSTLSDLPSPVANVITLAADTEYRFLSDINFGVNRLVLKDNTQLSGPSSNLITLTYADNGAFLTSNDSTNVVISLMFKCTSGSFISWTDTTNTALLSIRDVEIEAFSFGILTGSYSAPDGSIFNCGLTNFTGTAGILFDGSFVAVNIDTCSISTTNDNINLGLATFVSFFVDALLSVSTLGYTLSGLTASGNILPGGFAVISRIVNFGEVLDGITVNDATWLFRNNQNIADSHPDGLLSLQGNATNTVITVTGTPVLVAGTWVVEGTSQATGTAAGRVTYDGVKDVRWPLAFTVSLRPVSGSNKQLAVYFAKNGTVIANSKRTATVSSGGLASVSGLWQDTFSTGDYIEVFVANDTDTVDILVESAILQVN